MLLDAAHLDPVAAVGKDVADRLFGREQAALLVDDDAVERRGEGDLALVGLDFAGQQLEQGRLARAVRADDADAVAALDAEGEVLDDRAVAEALGDMVGGDHRFRAHIVVGEAELGDAGAADHRGAGRAHFVQLFEPALVALAPRGDAALQPVRFEPELGVELFGGARLLGEHRLHPRVEAAEADLLAADAAAIEPQGLARQPGEKGAVVADRDEGAGVAREPAFEPVDCGEVEVVGRLVEQQHVGVLRERAGDRGAAPLAARGARGLAAHVDAELVGDRGDLMLGRGIGAVDRIVHQRREAAEIGFLFEQHDMRAGDDRALALVGVDAAGEQLQQRRLARAVAADQREPVALADIDVEILEQPAAALHQAEAFIR